MKLEVVVVAVADVDRAKALDTQVLAGLRAEGITALDATDPGERGRAVGRRSRPGCGG